MAEYASNGVATAGLTTGIIGTALGVLGGNLGNILNGGWGGYNNPYYNGGGYVSRETFEMAQKVAARDSEIALLKSEQNTEIKIADVYERIMTRVNADAKAQAEVNAAQAVFNAGTNSAINLLQNQIGILNGLTKTVIPGSSICPEMMPRYNSWTAPTE